MWTVAGGYKSEMACVLCPNSLFQIFKHKKSFDDPPQRRQLTGTCVPSPIDSKITNMSTTGSDNDFTATDNSKLDTNADALVSPKKYQQTSHKFIPRYNGPHPSQMTPAQTTIYESIIQSRPLTGISGPFGPWLAIPSIANPAQELGKACRYGTSLSFRESELVILLTGARHKSHAEFDIHVGEALRAGICISLIESIPRDGDFSSLAVEEEIVPLLLVELEGSAREVEIVRFVAELLETSSISDERYNAAKQVLGESVLVEVTSIVGYYTFCAYTLNVFRIPTKDASASSDSDGGVAKKGDQS